MQKAILVNGASGSIGSVGVLQLAQAGFRVFAGVLDESEAQQIEDLHDNIGAIILDVTDERSVHEAIAHVESALGQDKLYGLWSNAGIIDTCPFTNLAAERIRQTIDVNLTGTLLLLHSTVPLLQRDVSRVVITGSATGLFASPTASVYTATKAGLEGFVDALRIELLPSGITVSLIEPGLIQGNMPDAVRPGVAKVLEQMSDQDKSDYEPMLNTLIKVSDKAPTPPEQVAKTVVAALNDKRAKSRYRVGVDAKAVALLRHLPDGMRDYIQKKIFGL